MLISLDNLKASEKRFKDWKDAPKAKKASVAKKKAGDGTLTVEENLKKRKEMLRSTSIEPAEFAYERAIGKNDSVYSNFCELITLAKQKVGRIVIKEGSKNKGFATGFLVSDRLMLTNWHVFKTKDEVADSEVEFSYELDVFGRSIKPITFRFSENDFFHTMQSLDYCFIAVEPKDITGKVKLSSIGYHYLNPMTGKLGEEGKEYLNIIHHPDGDYKQLSIRENKFIKIQPKTLWYETDTAQGSSGSPVFNDQWQVVALHHMGVPAKTADGKNYLDKDNKIIKPVGNQIDTAKIKWIANEGIRISVIMKDIFTKFPKNAFIEALKLNPEGQESLLVASQSEPENDHSSQVLNENHSSQVQISIPVALLQSNGNITLNIQNDGGINKSVIATPKTSGGINLREDLLEEAFKIDIENEMNYSACKGYKSDFLGVNIPIPKPKKSIEKYVAKLKANKTQTILNYHHFSVIHHVVRRMPIISAINVDGDPNKRKDNYKRDDVWLRDNRIDYAIQLNDSFYKNSGFDKGHLSRREDADWGSTPEEAKKNADLTCVYTNVCPQVGKLNQSKLGGLWGKLEMIILEEGAREEKGKAAKISVFNGPIFSDNDKIYKGIQIPVEFWKIVLWYNAKSELKATAFKLSQAKLVGDIDFEELDFNMDPEFQSHQISIKELEKLTQIDFSTISKYDTFKASAGVKTVKLNSEKDVVKQIKK